MPSFAIPKFIILLEPLWVSAVFLLLSTGPFIGPHAELSGALVYWHQPNTRLASAQIPRDKTDSSISNFPLWWAMPLPYFPNKSLDKLTHTQIPRTGISLWFLSAVFPLGVYLNAPFLISILISYLQFQTPVRRILITPEVAAFPIATGDVPLRNSLNFSLFKDMVTFLIAV